MVEPVSNSRVVSRSPCDNQCDMALSHDTFHAHAHAHTDAHTDAHTATSSTLLIDYTIMYESHILGVETKPIKKHKIKQNFRT